MVEMIYWTGTAWSSRKSILPAYGGDGGGWTVPDFIVHAADNIEAYALTSTFGLEKWIWNGISWSKVATILGATELGAIRSPMVVHDYTDELRCIVTVSPYLCAINSELEFVRAI